MLTESFETARNLIMKEGILCGGSSGSNVHAALEIARGLPADKNVNAVELVMKLPKVPGIDGKEKK
ncbi:hypothetical protein NECAME_05023 [Necator americanus]|uniref:Tryptophan synthase beta chain-like PALP domain-containing protein n=1 Tax=Necator americanus TaxID=51031 RepID=W2SNC4_NECAM|nr:hypothetical protein NECAME_05023 [Necator americanus]ETN70202.1 hypothetical protein NECAME_05023 [Necator americanus]